MKRFFTYLTFLTYLIVSTSLTAFGAVNKDDIYKILVAANKKNVDFYQKDSIHYIGPSYRPASTRTVRNSVATDCRVLRSTIDKGYGITYYNYFHNAKKRAFYAYNSKTKKTQKYSAKEMKKTLSNKNFEKFVELSDNALKLVTDNSKITQNQNGITITTNFTKAQEKQIIKDKEKASPDLPKGAMLHIKYTIQIQNNKITKINLTETMKPDNTKFTIKVNTTISYAVQKIKAYIPK